MANLKEASVVYMSMIRDHPSSLESGNPVAQPSVGRMYSLCFVVIIVSVSLFCHRYAFSEILPEKLRRAAEQGSDAAQLELGYMYYDGEGVPKDLVAAVRWFRKAAEQGNDFAQAELGYMYYNGEGVPKDLAAAARWYRKAAEQGNNYAQGQLGHMYYNGEGVPKDLAAAVRWFHKAAEQGNDFAQAVLGYMYYSGEGVLKDSAAAARWFRKAAEQGNDFAQVKLGDMYYNGEGVPKDYLLSYAWSSLAAAKGQKYAKDLRDSLERIMTPNQVAEAQRISRKIDAQIASGEKPEMFFHLNRVKQQPVSSGSGFLVGTKGEILTNYHVINKCDRLTVKHGGTEHGATVKAGDETNDLALLVAHSVKGFVSTLSVSPQTRLGEIVQVAGYPLSGILSNDLNITSGNVSALAGLANNVTHLQITAPIQPGNSGGPLLDETGNVVGIVVSQLNAIETARYTGSLPQNVNFAIKVSVARMFLENHGVTYRRGTSDSKMSPEKIADLARGFTVAVQCW